VHSIERFVWVVHGGGLEKNQAGEGFTHIASVTFRAFGGGGSLPAAVSLRI
jgi:hypothetical protein